MIVHVREYGSESDIDDLEPYAREEKRPRLAQSAPTRRAFATRTVRAAPILEPDDDFEDFDVSAFVERTYQ